MLELQRKKLVALPEKLDDAVNMPVETSTMIEKRSKISHELWYGIIPTSDNLKPLPTKAASVMAILVEVGSGVDRGLWYALRG